MGGFRSILSDLTLINSTVTNNRTGYGGAGIFSSGHLDVIDSVIANNDTYASGIGTSFRGGGISFRGTLNIVGSVISGNHAGESGGGIAAGPDAELSIVDSIIRDNIAGSSFGAGGGGVYVYAGTTATVVNSTLTGNSPSAIQVRNQYYGNGNPTEFTISDSVITGNSGTGLANYGTSRSATR